MIKVKQRRWHQEVRALGSPEVYSKDYSTSMLIWHIKRHHKDVYKHHIEAKGEEKEDGKGDSQRSIKPFLNTCPSFEHSLINWMISTYQVNTFQSPLMDGHLL